MILIDEGKFWGFKLYPETEKDKQWMLQRYKVVKTPANEPNSLIAGVKSSLTKFGCVIHESLK